ncbi:hypothetical protein GP486_001975 [Trichoglossum hirsutum]|uniref:Uncharacterized protein n=1 Tax=Trichoglossum hirsutum TaxID=265104 RepID=A0A9P8LFN3_9PEZI|nr:hypothetical protein GP486_001975 [Trichoglossum hirsutum]
MAELVTGSKTPDPGVKSAMLKALYEVVSKAGSNMSDTSRSTVLGLANSDIEEEDYLMAIANARLLGALLKYLPPESTNGLIRKPSVLNLNAVLLESPEVVIEPFAEETVSTICQGISQKNPFISDNCVLAAGKYLLTETGPKSFETTKPLFEALASVIQPGAAIDTRRLGLVVIRTVSRLHIELIRPHLALLAPKIFASVRDLIIPIKLSAEAAFLAIFSVVDSEGVVFEKYLSSAAGMELNANTKRSMQDYFRRVALKLGAQARERKEAEGGQGGLGLGSDEVEDEREIWSVGKVDLGEDQLGE